MELKSVRRDIAFDLVKRWVSDTLHREIQDTVPEGCPWQALSAALASTLPRFSGKTQAEIEEDLRMTLVVIYFQLLMHDPVAMNDLAEAKLDDETSIFRMGYYPDVASIIRHWKWYLHCLSHMSNYFTHGKEFRQPPDQFVVRMPLDLVDLSILSRQYEVRITVLKHNEAQSIAPPLPAGENWPRVHLVCHEGLWASVGGPRQVRGRALESSLVELGDLPDAFQNFSRRTVCLAGQNEEEKCLRAICGDQFIPLDRLSISRVIQTEASTSTSSSAEPRRFGRAVPAPPIVGIPDGAFEFQLLLDFVRERVGEKLKWMRSQKQGQTYTGIDNKESYKQIVECEYKELTPAAFQRAKRPTTTKKAPPPERPLALEQRS